MESKPAEGSSDVADLSEPEKIVLDWFCNHFTDTGKPGVTMDQFELERHIGLESDQLRDAIRGLENKGVLSTSMRSHNPGVPYITLRPGYRPRRGARVLT